MVRQLLAAGVAVVVLLGCQTSGRGIHSIPMTRDYANLEGAGIRDAERVVMVEIDALVIEACRAVAKGFCRGHPGTEAVLFPIADGGDGTVEALVAATSGRLVRKKVRGPLGEPVRAAYGILGDGRTAVVEMAKASGLALVPPDRRDPLKTTTYGTGELIADALEGRDA